MELEKEEKIRYFYSDRFMVDKEIREKSKNKISAKELVIFDTKLLEFYEIQGKNIEKYYIDTYHQILAVIKHEKLQKDNVIKVEKTGFYFCGFDLVERFTKTSTITNYGGAFDDIIPYHKLNLYGLIEDLETAIKVKEQLIKEYQDQQHTYCEVYEIWRKLKNNKVF